ncbi:MAG: HEPN domain-containing protein [Archaeoglobaceae archaeon]
MRRETELWLRTAEEDLVDSKSFLASKRYFRSAFFAQQAVEKVLKALFIEMAREDPPKIHSVTELYGILKEKTGFKLSDELEEQLFVLNKYYTVSRYPDAANGLPSESVDRIEAERALKISEEIFDYARGFIRNKEKS